MNRRDQKNFKRISELWSEEVEDLLKEWAEKASCWRWLFSRSEKKYRYKYYKFSIPVIILSTLNYIKGETVLPGTEIGGVGKSGVVQKIGFKNGDIIQSINGVQVYNWKS